MERKNPASQPHACFFLYPTYGFCVSMGPPEKALLLLLLTTKSNEPNTRYLEHFIQGHMQPVPFLDPTAECVFLRALCLSLPSWETHPVRPAWRQLREEDCLRVTASSPAGPDGSPKQVTTHRTCDVVLRESKTVPFKISVSLQRNKTPPSILLWAALTSSWHLYPCCRRLQNKHVIAALASTALGLVFISREAFACSMHRCTCPAISLSFSALVTAATA